MITNHAGCFARRWFALAGLILSASVVATPGALGQTTNPSGVLGPTLSSVKPTQSDLHDAGVVVPGWPRSASEVAETDQPVTPSTEAAPQGPVDPSGVIGAAAASAAPTPSDLSAAGVVHVW